ncbi:MAG: cation-efflux pump [Desulfovibrio sp.]|jgi:cation diffusion facilitator family transporter|nr:cation-efflux pump [Desulfovibrio sp.]
MQDSMPLDEAGREKNAAALTSVFAAIGLTAMKLAVGLVANSLGMLSEALHSGLDLLAAGMTYFAVRYASLPPNATYTYGRGKIENLSALVEAVLLLITCGWIVWEAADRLFFNPVPVTPSLWAVGVMSVSIIVDYSRSRLLRRMAEKHRSQALEADALHFSTDIWSSFVVLLGIGCLYLADLLPHASALRPWLEKADAVAALGVAGIVVHVSLSLGRRAVGVLLDAADEKMRDDIMRALTAMPGIRRIRRLRLRQSGADLFVEVMLCVDSTLAIDATTAFRRGVEHSIKSIAGHAAVSVEFVPDDADLADRVAYLRGVAATYGLSSHSVELIELQGPQPGERQLLLELHAVMDPALTLGEAHAQVCRFEKRVIDHFKDVIVVTHFAPMPAGSGLAKGLRLDEEYVRTVAEELVAGDESVEDCHNILFRANEDARYLSFHCRMPGQSSISEAHDKAARLQRAMLRRIPELSRVTVHMEPVLEPGPDDAR